MKKKFIFLMFITFVGYSGYSIDNLSIFKTVIPDWIFNGPIYEMNVRNFTSEGTFRSAEKNLSYLSELGIKTIWLLPFHPTGSLKKLGTFGSPYSIRNHYEVNEDFGTLDDFKMFVESVHKMGMKLLMDFVPNQTSWDNVWITTHNSWYKKDNKGQIVPPLPMFGDVAGLDLANQELKFELINILKFWKSGFNVDGFRCDLSSLVPTSFWQEIFNDEVIGRDTIFISEIFNLKFIEESGFPFVYGYPLYSSLRTNWNQKGNFEEIIRLGYRQQEVLNGRSTLNYITNHDEYSWTDSPAKVFTSIEGMKAASIIAWFMPGVPLIYTGQEVGYDRKINLFEKTELNLNKGNSVYSFYKSINTIYIENPVFNYFSKISVEYSKNGIICFSRYDKEKKAIILVNTTSNQVDLENQININEYNELLSSSNLVKSGSKLTVGAFGYWIGLK